VPLCFVDIEVRQNVLWKIRTIIHSWSRSRKVKRAVYVDREHAISNFQQVKLTVKTHAASSRPLHSTWTYFYSHIHSHPTQKLPHLPSLLVCCRFYQLVPDVRWYYYYCQTTAKTKQYECDAAERAKVSRPMQWHSSILWWLFSTMVQKTYFWASSESGGRKQMLLFKQLISQIDQKTDLCRAYNEPSWACQYESQQKR